MDALNAGNWQRGGGKGRKPKPVPRPGVEDDSKQTRRFGSAKIPIEQAKARWDRINRPVEAAPVNTICTADGCDRSDIKARQLCPAHYMRWWRESKR